MNQVAKLLLIDENDQYLMLFRSSHPTFLDDPDLPGGTVEAGEDALVAMVREVMEEAGITIQQEAASLLYQGDDYSAHRTKYYLYTCRLDKRPPVTISWEHASYDWLERSEFIKRAAAAKDTFMHMVADVSRRDALL